MRLKRLFSGTRARPSIFEKDYLFLRALARDLRQAIDEITDQALTVLDVGSSYKPYASLFDGKDARFLALDTPPARPTLDIVGSAETLPVKTGSVDVCLCTQVLEHVERPELVLPELARVLRPGGVLLLSTHGVFHHHPYPHDYWRWTDEGLRKITVPSFREVSVKNNGGTLLLLFHIVGRGVMFLAEHNKYLRVLQYTIYPLINVAGMVFDKIIPEASLSLNYLVVGIK